MELVELSPHRSRAVLVVGQGIPVVQPPDLYDLDAEGLEPGEQSLQGGLILNGAVNDRLDRLDRGGEPAKIEQGLGRKDARYPDFVVRRWHHRPLPLGITRPSSYRYPSGPGAPHS